MSDREEGKCMDCGVDINPNWFRCFECIKKPMIEVLAPGQDVPRTVIQLPHQDALTAAKRFLRTDKVVVMSMCMPGDVPEGESATCIYAWDKSVTIPDLLFFKETIQQEVNRRMEGGEDE